jgi:4'-phosphopantetheinyl transferase EntD
VIEAILPAKVAAAEAFGDELAGPVFPEEAAHIAHAVARRQQQFGGVRHCARIAMAELGLPASAILPAERGAPRWPDGVVGSMTHCDGYLAAAVGRMSEVLTIGIDAEPHAPLPDGVLDMVTSPAEREMLAHLHAEDTHVCWDRLLFTAKESIYKAWYPLTRTWLGFEDAEIAIDPLARTFSSRLLKPGPETAKGAPVDFSGQWLASEDLIISAIAILT